MVRGPGAVWRADGGAPGKNARIRSRAVGIAAHSRAIPNALKVSTRIGEVATTLFISEKTAGVHVSNILRKLDLRSRVEASAYAYRLGLLDEPGA